MQNPILPSIDPETAPNITMSTNKILLEVLVYGEEKDKDKIKLFLDGLQGQINRGATGLNCRVLYFFDKGEKTEEEKKQWLVENSNSKYYVFANQGDNYEVNNKFMGFIKECLTSIKKLENSIASTKALGILMAQKTEKLKANEQV